MDDKLAKLRETAKRTIFSEKRFNEEQKEKVYRKIRQEQHPRNKRLHYMVMASFTVCFFSFTGYLISDELTSSGDNSQQEKTVQMEEPADSQEKRTIQLEGPFDPKGLTQVPKEHHGETGEVLGLDETALSKENVSINLELTFNEQYEEVKMTGSIQAKQKELGIDGSGWVIPVEVENHTYYYISFDAAYTGGNLQKKEKQEIDYREGNGGGILYVDAEGPHNFRGSFTIDNAEGMAVMFFGEGYEVVRIIEDALNETEEEK